MFTKLNKFLFFAIILISSIGLGNIAHGAANTNNNQNLPVVVSAFITPIDSTSVVLNGSVIPNGRDTDAWFHMGPASSGPIQLQHLGNGTNPVTLVPYTLTGLTPGNLYNFRIEANNASGTTYGSWVSFSTSTSTNCVSPTIHSISPSSSPAGSGSILVAVSGSNFTNTTLATFNGLVRVVNILNSSQMIVYLPASDLASPGVGNIQVYNGTNCVSGLTTFTISPPGGSGGFGYPFSYPSVITEEAGIIKDTSAMLYASINPNNSATLAWFEYSTYPNLYQSSRTNDTSFGGGATYYSTLSQDLTNLAPETKYYFRAVGRNHFGTTRGNIFSFTTAKASVASDTTKTTVAPTPAPETPKTPAPTPAKTKTPSAPFPWLVVIGIAIIVILIAIIFAKARGKH